MSDTVQTLSTIAEYLKKLADVTAPILARLGLGFASQVALLLCAGGVLLLNAAYRGRLGA